MVRPLVGLPQLRGQSGELERGEGSAVAQLQHLKGPALHPQALIPQAPLSQCLHILPCSTVCFTQCSLMCIPAILGLCERAHLHGVCFLLSSLFPFAFVGPCFVSRGRLEPGTTVDKHGLHAVRRQPRALPRSPLHNGTPLSGRSIGSNQLLRQQAQRLGHHAERLRQCNPSTNWRDVQRKAPVQTWRNP